MESCDNAKNKQIKHKQIMKKNVFPLLLFMIAATLAPAQQLYWVTLADKNGVEFNPYSYFDNKAIERYRQNGADLYDESNKPLRSDYTSQVLSIATEEVGQSRWLNAVAVTATNDQIAKIQQLDCVKEIVAIGHNMQLAVNPAGFSFGKDTCPTPTEATLSDQLIRMGGRHFRAHGINGKGVRIAVFDGGFPQVDTHPAFKHLRDGHRIIKTYNFPKKSENVYGWNSHGTMTLSCIAGRKDSMDLGMATGAEFLLARTEVGPEPFKEEVWWQMAVEWADQNGAQIISSSLGYGKDRYYTRDMDGQTYVAKAANMAARKGILVCNSAGNEGSDRHWRTIITPADADSALCVGGIVNSLTRYERIDFSSYGPSADGRQKPNVCAFGKALVANPSSTNPYKYVYGTSFSCPLVAGFAACAMQSRPELNGMALFREIEKSADLYPYCDYSLGYGVPQADHFTSRKGNPEKTFSFKTSNDGKELYIIPTEGRQHCNIFIKNTNSEGQITNYVKYELNEFNDGQKIAITGGNTVTAHLDGYTDSYAMDQPSTDGKMHVKVNDNNKSSMVKEYSHGEHFSESLTESVFSPEYFLQFGTSLNTRSDEMKTSYSPSTTIGLRCLWNPSKFYALGAGISYTANTYNIRKTSPANEMETFLGASATIDNADKIKSRHTTMHGAQIELFQRVRFLAAGLFHKGLHWDLGAYMDFRANNYYLQYKNNNDAVAATRTLNYRNLENLKEQIATYGLTTRISYDFIGIYARYQLGSIIKNNKTKQVVLPRLEVGIQFAF